LAFTPSIHANINKESELVEITTEVCGLPGMKPQSVQLSKSDAEAIDRLFEEIKSKLDVVESREEAVEIFNDAIVELDKYGLLGGLSVQQAQRLVTGIGKSKIIERISNIINQQPAATNSSENYLCLVAGKATETRIGGALYYHISHLSYIMPDLFSRLLSNPILFFFLVDFAGLILLIFKTNFPFNFRNIIYCGSLTVYGQSESWTPSNGWIFSLGILGPSICDGVFYGHVDEIVFPNYVDDLWLLFAGIRGFVGINIHGESVVENYLLGTCLSVNVNEEKPE